MFGFAPEEDTPGQPTRISADVIPLPKHVPRTDSRDSPPACANARKARKARKATLTLACPSPAVIRFVILFMFVLFEGKELFHRGGGRTGNLEKQHSVKRQANWFEKWLKCAHYAH